MPNLKNILKELFNQYKEKNIQEIVDDTNKYANRFSLSSNSIQRGHNDEIDAFRHAYMSALFSRKYGQFPAKIITDNHERNGNSKGQPSGESNMDLWNNAVGRDIANEMYRENRFNGKTNDEIKDIIAQKIVDRIKHGKLITTPSDVRIYKENNFQTKHTANMNKPFTREQIKAMSTDEFKHNEAEIMKQLKNNQIKKQSPNFSVNPLQNNRIFTREDIKNMTSEEYSFNEKDIMNQLKNLGVPSNNDLVGNPNIIYVQPYTKADGTKVKGYYRAK